MTREELQTASDELRQASEAASEDLVERLYEQSNALATLATRDADPDQGRLDRHAHTLAELADAADGDVAEHIRAARAAVQSYREGVGGV
jgi:cell division septum initiation protein DivIVA